MPEYLFREVAGLPCPMLPGESTSGDSCIMGIAAAAIYFRKPVADLQHFWLQTFTQTLKLSDPPAIERITHDRTNAADPSADRLRVYRLLRSAGYPELSDRELDVLLEFCRIRKLNPLAKHVYPNWRRDSDGTRVIEFRLTIDAMWELVRRGGGFDGNKTKHVLGDDGRPARTVCYLWRLDGDRRVKYRAEVECAARYPGPGKSDIWDRDPWRMNEKNAEAAVIRKAYPEMLAGVYSVDEPGFNPDRDAVTQAAPLSNRDLAIDPFRNQPWPQTPMAFDLALVDCGIKTEAARKTLKTALHAELPDCSGPAFYREALRLIYAEPSRWGAKHPVTEEV